MTEFSVLLAPEALSDVRQVVIWIGEQSPLDATKWHNGVMAAIQTLATHPLRCPLAPEDSHFELEIRQLIYGRYRILFSIAQKRIRILRVLHGARDYILPDIDDTDFEM